MSEFDQIDGLIAQSNGEKIELEEHDSIEKKKYIRVNGELVGHIHEFEDYYHLYFMDDESEEIDITLPK